MTCQTAAVKAAETVGVVVGENLERLRHLARMTQHEASRLFARRGAPLSRSKIEAIEKGRRTNLTFGDVLLIAHTVNVELAELFEGDGEVSLSEHVVLSRAAIRDLIRGVSVLTASGDWDPASRHNELVGLADLRAAADAEQSAGFRGFEADRTLAQRLGIAASAVIGASVQLWGRTLTEERDARVKNLGDLEMPERQAHRGHITRELSQQIQIELVSQGLISDPSS